MKHRHATVAVLTLAALVATLHAADARAALARDLEPPDAVSPYPGYVSEIYADPDNWLCRPDKDDVCDHELDTTVVRANGATRLERWRPARKPKIDCFYVYPTISLDETGNSDLVPDEDEELFVVRQQAARLGSVCRVFAPVYRQITLTALVGRMSGQDIPSDRALAYGDVVDAFKHYIANDNHGRGFILIGHSQGAGHLTALVRDEIDQNPVLRERLVSAMLLGTSLQVPVGRDVGGDFQRVPLCRRATQTGCAISYVTFRSTAPPPENSLFGGSREPGLQAACTNPASLAGGRGVLEAYLPTTAQSLPILPPPPRVDWLDPSLGVEIETPFVTTPGLFEAECAEHDGFHYLSVFVNGDPSDPRIDDITGADLTPEWGLHLVDVNLAMGNLVEIAETQARSWCARQRRCFAQPLPRR